MSHLYDKCPHVKSVESLDESHIYVTCETPWSTVTAMEVAVSLELFEDWAKTDKSISDTGLSCLSSEEREFILTGITPKNWEDIFGLLESGDE